jgi:tetratricopeptide (TPR) repeat protein
MTRSPEARARLTPILADAFNGIAWQAFLDVTLKGNPADGLKDVLADSDKAVALAPEGSAILDTRAQIRLKLGLIDEAFADLEKAIALGAEFEGTFYARGQIHERRNNRDAAIADYRKAVDLAKKHPRLSDYGKFVVEHANARLAALGVAVDPPKPGGQ